MVLVQVLQGEKIESRIFIEHRIENDQQFLIIWCHTSRKKVHSSNNSIGARKNAIAFSKEHSRTFYVS